MAGSTVPTGDDTCKDLKAHATPDVKYGGTAAATYGTKYWPETKLWKAENYAKPATTTPAATTTATTDAATTAAPGACGPEDECDTKVAEVDVKCGAAKLGAGILATLAIAASL